MFVRYSKVLVLTTCLAFSVSAFAKPVFDQSQSKQKTQWKKNTSPNLQKLTSIDGEFVTKFAQDFFDDDDLAMVNIVPAREFPGGSSVILEYHFSPESIPYAVIAGSHSKDLPLSDWKTGKSIKANPEELYRVTKPFLTMNGRYINAYVEVTKLNDNEYLVSEKIDPLSHGVER